LGKAVVHGHPNKIYLHELKEQGDYLIVGLNSDYSVKRLKGKMRPINTEEERAEILLAIKYVDLVIIFEEDTPIQVLEMVKPNIHIKGGDYIAELLPEYETVINNGGEVKILDLYAKKSTSDIVNKLIL